MSTKTRIRICIGLLFLFTGMVNLLAQVSTPVPIPKEVVSGKLANGMSYYIKHNEEPKNRVSLYFAQNVGAILEEDDQDGLAHFLEHMAFAGSEHFKPGEQDSFLAEAGLKAGREVNAYTSLDETVYNIDNIPTGDEKIVDKCLWILYDWSGSLNLEESEIDKERGVVAEEWRQGYDEYARVQEKTMPVVYAGSKYAKRDIIGKMDFIRTFPYSALREYYKKWYRPDLQAVVVVGDVDVKKMEEKIKERFSKIPMPQNAAERPYYKVPHREKSDYVLATDKYLTDINISWSFRKDNSTVKDEAYQRANMVFNLFRNILNLRYSEKLENQDCTALGLSISKSGIAFDKHDITLSVAPKNGKLEEAFKELYTEVVRLERFGILSAELERAKKLTLLNYVNAVEDEENVSNSRWATALAQHYLRAEPVQKAEDELAVAKKLLNGITKEEVAQAAQLFNERSNSYFIVTGPEDDTVSYPSKEKLIRLIDEVRETKIAPYTEELIDTPLIDTELPMTGISKSFKIKGTKRAKGYELENGVKIMLFPSKEKKNQVNLQSFSWGGLSLIPTNDYLSALAVDGYLSGVGNFSPTQLNKKLSGRDAYVKPYVDELFESINGYSATKDIELLLQLYYLQFEQPRFDQKLFESKFSDKKEELARSKKDNQTIFGDKVILATNNNHPRARPINPEDYDRISYEKSVEIYKKRFANAAQFKFMLSGDFEEAKVLPLLRKYLGNLSASTSAPKETYVDHGLGPKKGVTEIAFVQKMNTPQTSVSYTVIKKGIPYNIKNLYLSYILDNLLNMRYNDTIREEEGGSYGVSTATDMEQFPNPKLTLDVAFNCNPKMTDRLVTIMKSEIEKMAATGANKSDFEKAKSNMLKSLEQQKGKDDYQISQASGVFFQNEKFVPLEKRAEIIRSLTPKMIRKFTKKFLKGADVVEVIMNPAPDTSDKSKASVKK